jgi:negative regulator of flagellin synthesis FlgM
MRVTSKPSSPGTAPVSGVSKSAASSQVNAPSAIQGTEVVGDALSVSSTAQFIAVAEAHLAKVPDIRMEKVDALKAQMESDHYHPDGEAVAKGIVKEYTPLPKEP